MKKGKYVMEGLFKVFNIAGMAFIFVGGTYRIYIRQRYAVSIASFCNHILFYGSYI